MGFVKSAVSGLGNMVGGTLGIGGNAGSNFRASLAPIQQGVTTGQVGNAYNQTQSGLGQQQAFLNALMGVNGVQNQQNVFDQQQALAGQLQGLANGTGPNPALQQLQNTTGQNVAGQAALMAGQRGAGANAGLMARQIGNVGSNIQQQAVGQGALMSAEQQIAAMNALQNQQAMMGSLAGNQIQQQGAGLNAYNQFAQGQQQNLLGGLGQFNSANVSNYGNMNSANAGLAGQVAKNQGDFLGGIGKGVGSAIGFLSEGGMVGQPSSMAGRFLSGKKMADGGAVPEMTLMEKLRNSLQNPMGGGQEELYDPSAEPSKKGEEVPAPEGAKKKIKMNSGSMVPGQAAVKGDSLKNDKVPAMLSPKEIVIPRSITLAQNAPEKAKAFVAAVLARNGMR